MLNSWKKGWSLALSHKRVVWNYYFFNLVVLALACIPLMKVHEQFAGYSLMIKDGFSNFDYFADISMHESIAFNLSSISMLLGILMVVAIYLLLSAGYLALIKDEQSYSSKLFWGKAFEWFMPFIRLACWSLLHFITVIIVLFLLKALLSMLLPDDPYEHWTFWLQWLDVGLFLLSLFIWRSLFEFGRAELIKQNEKCTRKMIKPLFKALLNQELWKITVLNTLLGFVLLASYFFCKTLMGHSWATLLLAQIYLIIRIVIRLANYAGVWSLVNKKA